MKDLDLSADIIAIRAAQAAVAKRGEQLVEAIVELGRCLAQAKEKMLHGHWGQWLRENFDLSYETATNYLNVYRFSSRPEFRAAATNMPLEVIYKLARRGWKKRSRRRRSRMRRLATGFPWECCLQRDRT
jgi:hypothetical protein